MSINCMRMIVARAGWKSRKGAWHVASEAARKWVPTPNGGYKSDCFEEAFSRM